MERSEPALVPQWLRSAGSVSGGGSSAHPLASSSHTDAPSLVHHNRNRTSKNTSDFDSPRSPYLERSSSSNSRRSSSNGSAKHAYSSFNRSHRDKDHERDKEKSSFGDNWDSWDRDCSEPLANLFPGRIDKDPLRRSHSLVSRKHSEPLPRRAAADVKTGSTSSHNNGNCVLSGLNVGNSIQKAVFEKDFPSLGTEEKQGIPDIGRVPSPGLSTASQSLPVGSSALIGGEGWTSALAEVPAIIGSGSTGSLSVQQIVAPTSGSAASSAMAGLNMAEALSQTPSRARTAPQVSVKTHRLEELAIKQSRQLIPVTASMPKASVLSSSDKVKPKPAVRNAEMNIAAKSMPQQVSLLQLSNQSVRGGTVKLDAPKTSGSGKFLVLKPGWENGASPTAKDVASPTNNGNSRVGNQLSVVPLATSVPLRNPPNSQKPSTERKLPSLEPKSGPTLEKRTSLTQIQSRSDFFNLIKKKTSMNASTGIPDSGPGNANPSVERPGELSNDVASGTSSPHDYENVTEVTSNGDVCKENHRLQDPDKKETGPNDDIYPDEEEAAFLRSLGWEENSGEEEGLTEEEINAFYQEYMKLKPSLKICQGMQQSFSKLSQCHGPVVGGASAERSSSESESEA